MSGSTRQAPPHTLIFLHIPKTAGYSMHTIMDRYYAPAQVHGFDPHWPHAALEAFKALPLERRREIRLLRGHVGFGLHSWLPESSAYFTLLRHPVERAISHYYYLRRYIAAGGFILTRPWLNEVNRMSLEDYVRHGSSSDLRNGQVKLLSGAVAGWDTDRLEHHDPDDMLARAQANMDSHFLLAGLTERFEESVLLLCRVMGWEASPSCKLNVNAHAPTRADLSNQCLRTLVQCNEADLELYHHVQRRFESLLRETGVS